MFSVMLFLMYIVYITEKGTSTTITSFFDVVWYTLVTIATVGYGDVAPITRSGRLAGMFLLLFGVIIFGGISGKVASTLFDAQLKKDRGLIKLSRISGHFIICGWKPDFEHILDGIFSANPNLTTDQIVLINNAPQEQIDRIKSTTRFRGMKFLTGDYTDEATLLRANVKEAARVLVLADRSQSFSPLEIDSRTVLTILTIENLNPRIYTAAELIDSKFEKHLSLAKCDEIILTQDYERSLLVSASSGQGLSHVLRELLTEVSSEGLVIEDIPKEYVGQCYKDFRRSLSGGKVLIGILENTGNFYSRRKEALAAAQKNPDMHSIVENLKKVKLLKSNEPILTPPDEYVIPQNSRAIFVCGRKQKIEVPETPDSEKEKPKLKDKITSKIKAQAKDKKEK